jgi:PhnB protein
MANLSTYLTFNGNCRDAMTFYHQCLGGEITLQTFGEAPMDSPPGSENLVMHASITSGDMVLMASDGMPGTPVTQGTNFSININCDSQEQQDAYWSKLTAGGQITMPLDNTFWGARFGMLVDKFGIAWMLNFETANQNSN